MSEFEPEDFEIESTEPEMIPFPSIDDGHDRTVSSKETARRQLEEDMKRFLSGGGQISVVATNVRADPPRKPESNYGSRPI